MQQGLTALTKRSTWLVLACVLLACPFLGQRHAELHYAEFPEGAKRAVVKVEVQVPEGEWELSFEIGSDTESKQVTCPGGFCLFDFSVEAVRQGCEGLHVGVGVYLKTEPESEGCGTQPDPEVVPLEERERLFKFSFELEDVEIEPVSLVSCFGDVANPFEDGSDEDAGAFEDSAADRDADLGEVDQEPQDSGMDAEVDASEDADASSR